MSMGRPKTELVLGEDERLQLISITRSRSILAALVTRARMVLAAADGEPNSAFAQRLQLTRATVGKWRLRFLEQRINGLHDEVRPGKPRTIDDERVAQLIHKTLHTKPADGSTHWSVRTIAAETAISPTSVHRYFKLLDLQPHRSESFKLSTDQFFIEKLRDVAGLYLSPPENALVLCVDGKSQCQALERTQPMLPMGFGYVEGVLMTSVSINLPPTTTRTASHSCGPLPLTPSSPGYKDYVRESAERDTRCRATYLVT